MEMLSVVFGMIKMMVMANNLLLKQALILLQNTHYTVAFKYDYSHFVDANSADGTVDCFVNGVSSGEVFTTSRLYNHSGDIGLGGMNDGSYFSDGPATVITITLMEFYSSFFYNTAHTEAQVEKS